MPTFDSTSLDSVARHILRLLQEDARLSYAEIGRRVGLTPPAVAERMRRMEEAGIITGYHAAVHPEALGLPITAYLRVTATNGRCDPARDVALAHPTVTECYCIAGDQDLLIKGEFPSVRALQALADQLLRFGPVSTTLVLATYLPRRTLE